MGRRHKNAYIFAPRKTSHPVRTFFLWLLTLVLLPAAGRLHLPLALWFPVFLGVSFALAALLMTLAAPLSRLLKRAA